MSDTIITNFCPLTFSKSIHQITEIIGNKYKVSNNERLFKPHELLKIDQVENAPENDISIEIKKNKKTNKDKHHLKRLDANQTNITTKKRVWKPSTKVLDYDSD